MKTMPDQRSLVEQLIDTMQLATDRGMYDAADYLKSHLENGGHVYGAVLNLSPGRMARVKARYGCSEPVNCCIRGFHSDVK